MHLRRTLDPVIPHQVASPQSLAPFHRTTSPYQTKPLTNSHPRTPERMPQKIPGAWGLAPTSKKHCSQSETNYTNPNSLYTNPNSLLSQKG